MATTWYSFPTINGSDTVDAVNAINGLANSVDAALRNVANDIPSLDSINSQLATITQDIQTIKTNLSTTTTNANKALNDSATALSTAQNVNAAWSGSPVSILESYNSQFITQASNLTVYNWGNVVTVKVSAENLEYGTRNVVGKIRAGYWPTNTLLVAVLQQQTEGSPWAYFTIDTSTGEIAVNPTYSGSKPDNLTTVSTMMAYLVNVQG